MEISLLVKTLILATLAFIIYLPEILPKCANCGKIKLRSSFMFHIRVKMSLTRNGNLSLCKSCCEKENFTSVSKFRHYQEAKKKAGDMAGWKL